ncbi:MAG: GntR family transcriptional regulator [Cellvibrionaceae bacterium]|nr:GntR family transcriptional regulator [Cellvibrionaceae bacterium]
MSESSAKNSTTLATKITESIRTAIVSGDIAPGAKLSEAQLAMQFNSSRGPVREAIRRLEVERLVRHVPHEGARVITLERNEIVAIYQVRESLEGMAASLAAQHMSDEDIVALRQLWEQHRAHQHQTGEYMQADGDFDFHYRIIQGSRNPYLIRQLCDDLYQLLRMFRYRSSRFISRSAVALTEHEHIVYAIEQRDSQLAELVMRRHISRAARDIAQAMQTEETKL